jgi:hypothetical protein
MHFVYRRNRVADAGHDLNRQLETQVHAHGTDMEEHVPRRGDGVVLTLDLAKRVQLAGSWLPEKSVPSV